MTPWTAANDGVQRHAMTCDVEDYFQVSAFNDRVSIAEWKRYDCRIPRNVDLILERLEAADPEILAARGFRWAGAAAMTR